MPAEKAHARNADPTRIIVKGVFIPETNHQLATLIRDGTYFHEMCITILRCSCSIFGSCWCLVVSLLGSLWDYCGMTLGLCWGNVGVMLGSRRPPWHDRFCPASDTQNFEIPSTHRHRLKFLDSENSILAMLIPARVCAQRLFGKVYASPREPAARGRE